MNSLSVDEERKSHKAASTAPASASLATDNCFEYSGHTAHFKAFVLVLAVPSACLPLLQPFTPFTSVLSVT